MPSAQRGMEVGGAFAKLEERRSEGHAPSCGLVADQNGAARRGSRAVDELGYGACLCGRIVRRAKLQAGQAAVSAVRWWLNAAAHDLLDTQGV